MDGGWSQDIFGSRQHEMENDKSFVLGFVKGLFHNFTVGAHCDEGTPVPIPNTVVKLVNGDNTWLATAREDNSAPTLKATIRLNRRFFR